MMATRSGLSATISAMALPSAKHRCGEGRGGRYVLTKMGTTGMLRPSITHSYTAAKECPRIASCEYAMSKPRCISFSSRASAKGRCTGMSQLRFAKAAWDFSPATTAKVGTEERKNVSRWSLPITIARSGLASSMSLPNSRIAAMSASSCSGISVGGLTNNCGACTVATAATIFPITFISYASDDSRSLMVAVQNDHRDPKWGASSTGQSGPFNPAPPAVPLNRDH